MKETSQKIVMQNREKYYNAIKAVFMCFMAVYISVREIPALHFLIGSFYVSAAVFLCGIFVILWGLFVRPDAFRSRSIDLLFLYLLITAVSCFINRKYGIAENIRALGTMGLFFFLFFPALSCGEKSVADREYRRFLSMLSVVWTVFVLASILMYFYTVQTEVIKVTGERCTQGFNTQYRRLWGLFQDPNYAGFVCVAVMTVSVWWMTTTRKIIVRIAAVLVMLLNFFYIILGGSRSAQVVLYAAAVVGVLYAVLSAKRFSEKGRSVFFRIGIGGVSAAVSCCLLFGCTIAVTYVLPAMKYAIVSISSEETVTRVDAVYDGLFRRSGLEVKSTAAEKREEDVFRQSIENERDEPIRRTDLEKEDISNGRFDSWRQALQIFAKMPLIGVSPRNITAFAKEHNPDTVMAKSGTPSHNGYVDILVSTGILGFVTLFAFFVLCAVKAVKKYILLEGDRGFLFASVVFCAVAISGMFISDLFFGLTPGAVLFWYSLGRVCHTEHASEKPGFLYLVIQRLTKNIRKGNTV